MIGLGKEQETPALMVKNNNKQGGFAIIVSRTQGGRVLVSPSQITQVNMADVINQYSSSAALQAAIDSYGQGDEVFLDSNSANAIGQQPTTLSITGISGGAENAKIIATGGNVDLSKDGFTNNARVYFNQDVVGTPQLIKVTLGGQVIVTDQSPTWRAETEPHYMYSDESWDAQQGAQTGATLRVEVTISGVVYSADFVYESGTMS